MSGHHDHYAATEYNCMDESLAQVSESGETQRGTVKAHVAILSL